MRGLPQGIYAPLVRSTLAIEAVIEERKHQILEHGHDTAHDEQHSGGEIIKDPEWGVIHRLQSASITSDAYRKTLVKAAAMIIAEIERFDKTGRANVQL